MAKSFNLSKEEIERVNKMLSIRTIPLDDTELTPPSKEFRAAIRIIGKKIAQGTITSSGQEPNNLSSEAGEKTPR